MPYSDPPRRRKQRRPVRTLKPDHVATEFERIKQRLKQEGYKLRRNINANYTWKITGNFNGFYLVKYLPCGVWHVAPNDWHPSREILLQLIKEALSSDQS